MTASEYHIKYYQIMTAGEGHFQKDCMGVSQLKEMAESITIKKCQGEPQLKELPKKYVYTFIREYQNQLRKKHENVCPGCSLVDGYFGP